MKVDVGTGVVGQFSSDNLTENGRRIPILSQISINGSVEYLGIPDFHRAGGTFWADNLLSPHSSWVSGGNTTNQNWVIHTGGPYNNVSAAWRGAVLTRHDYVARNPENVRAAACHICDDSLQSRRRARMLSLSTSRNPVLNPRVNCRGSDQDGPIAQ